MRIEIDEEDDPLGVITEVMDQLYELGHMEMADQLHILVDANDGIVDLKEYEILSVSLGEAEEELETLRETVFGLETAREIIHRAHGGVETNPRLCVHPDCRNVWH